MKSKLRIAVDGQSLEGERTGVGRYLENILANWPLDSPHEVRLYFRRELPRDAFLRRSSWHLECLNASRSTAFYQHFKLSQVLGRVNPDVFWSPGYLLPMFYRGPSVLTIHDIIYEARPDLYTWPSVADQLLLRKLGKVSGRRANLILAPSEFTKAEIQKHYGVLGSKVLVTPLAPDRRFKLQKKRDPMIFRELGINNKYILFVGALIERRCIRQLIKAFEQLLAIEPEIQLVLVGPNTLKDQAAFRAKVAALNRKYQALKCIHIPFTDTKTLTQLYSFSSATVALSLYEGFGLPLLEAMACGAPVIVSRNEAYVEVGGRATLIIDNSESINEITRALERVVLDKGLATRLRTDGLARAREFSWSKTAQATISALESTGG